jgi:hypothetical protein
LSGADAAIQATEMVLDLAHGRAQLATLHGCA